MLPAFFGHGLIGNCLTALAAGGALHVWTHLDIAELRGLSDLIDRESITFMSSVLFLEGRMRMSEGPKHPPNPRSCRLGAAVA